MVDVSRIRFTKHAIAKFEVVKRYGFEITDVYVIEAVLAPDRVDKRDDQYFAIRTIDSKYALRVVYEEKERLFSCHNLLSC